MASNPTYEADNDHLMIKLILPSGQVKEKFIIKTKPSVAREKSRIIAEAQVREPPEKDIMLIMLQNEGKEVEMEEDKDMKFYVDDLISSTAIELRDRRNVTALSKGYNVDVEKTFACKMK